jgi:signal transduction histidine kinase
MSKLARKICRWKGNFSPAQAAFCCCLCFWLSLNSLSAQVAPPPLLQLLYFADTANQYNFQDIQQLPEQAWSPRYRPLMQGSVWLRFTVAGNATASTGNASYVLYPGDIPYLTLYLQQGEELQHFSSGHLLPIAQRSHPHYKPLFRLNLQPQEQVTAWLKMNTANLQPLPETFKPALKAAPVQQQEDERRLLIQGLFFGIILVMAFYNFMLYIAVRDISYLYYVLSILGIGFYFFFYYGFSLQTIWQNKPVWNAYSFALIVPLTNMMRLMFTKTYLHTKDTLPWLNRFLNLLLVLSFIPIIMGVLAYWLALPWYEWTIDATGIMGTVVLTTMLFAGVLTYRRGYTPALFFILANVLFVLGANMFIIKEMHLIEDSLPTRYAVQLGVIAQVVLFSLGLAYRLKKARQEAAAQSLARERLEHEKEKERKHLVEKQKKELEKKVKERTAALQQKTHELQTTISKLQESEEGLRRLNKIKDKLFSVVSHDLRGPVATLDSFISLITRHAAQITEEEMDKLAGKTKESVHNLAFLLDNLLNWSRAQMGTQAFRSEAFSLQEVVQKNRELYALNAENKKLSLITDVPKEAVASGDRGMVDFIVRNLLSNAIKFTPAYGTIKIISHQEGGALILSISDTGVGMSAEQIALVLDPENSYSTPGTAREKGTGLGLMLCQEFLAHHNSLLQLNSLEGKGSCFRFSLPRAAESLIQASPDFNKLLLNPID